MCALSNVSTHRSGPLAEGERDGDVVTCPWHGSQFDLCSGEGEVSPYLTDVLVAGDRLEIRGPIGGYFAWGSRDGGPLFLVAGGSGVVPLMAMIGRDYPSTTVTPRRATRAAWLRRDPAFP